MLPDVPITEEEAQLMAKVPQQPNREQVREAAEVALAMAARYLVVRQTELGDNEIDVASGLIATLAEHVRALLASSRPPAQADLRSQLVAPAWKVMAVLGVISGGEGCPVCEQNTAEDAAHLKDCAYVEMAELLDAITFGVTAPAQSDPPGWHYRYLVAAGGATEQLWAIDPTGSEDPYRRVVPCLIRASDLDEVDDEEATPDPSRASSLSVPQQDEVLHGTVIDAGGGELRLMVDRSTDAYPVPGTDHDEGA